MLLLYSFSCLLRLLFPQKKKWKNFKFISVLKFCLQITMKFMLIFVDPLASIMLLSHTSLDYLTKNINDGQFYFLGINIPTFFILNKWTQSRLNASFLVDR